MTTGLNDLTLRDLAAQLGTSHRILIYHFKSKENLINLAVSEVRRRERELFQKNTASRVADEAPDLRSSLTMFFEHNISDGMRPYFRLLYEVWGIAQAKPETWAQFLDGIVLGWVDSLTDVFVRAGYPADLARTRATIVLAALRGLQLDLFTTHEESRVRHAFDALVELILGEASVLTPVPATTAGEPQQETTVQGTNDL